MTDQKLKELEQKFYKECVDHHPDFISEGAIHMGWKDVFRWFVENFKGDNNDETFNNLNLLISKLKQDIKDRDENIERLANMID